MKNYKGRIPGTKNKTVKQNKRIIYSISIYEEELSAIKKAAFDNNKTISRYIIEKTLS